MLLHVSAVDPRLMSYIAIFVLFLIINQFYIIPARHSIKTSISEKLSAHQLVDTRLADVLLKRPHQDLLSTTDPNGPDEQETRASEDRTVTVKDGCDSNRSESNPRYPYQPIPKSTTQGSAQSTRLPAAYRRIEHVGEENEWCAERFSPQFLYDFRDNQVQYCDEKSESKITCFHTSTDFSGRIDSLCIGQGAMYDPQTEKLVVDCEERELTDEELEAPFPRLDELTPYWYETGPLIVLNETIEIDSELWKKRLPPIVKPKKHTILVKREMEDINVWHVLMQVFSVSITLDVLRIAKDPKTSKPYLIEEDLDHVQLAIVDGHEDGPLFEFWSIFSNTPPKRYKELAQDAFIEQNFIIPLAGGGNPIWQGDWVAHECTHSELLSTLKYNILDYFGLTDLQRDTNDPLVITIIERKKTRHLQNVTDMVTTLSTRFPAAKVHVVSFEGLSLKEQIGLVRKTDVLVGVHGAGLTHGLFMHHGSAMVEIQPYKLDFKGFRNMANFMGHKYFTSHSTNATELEVSDDWHENDVRIESKRFLDVVEVAVRSMYNGGLHSQDADL